MGILGRFKLIKLLDIFKYMQHFKNGALKQALEDEL
jgi:hypothetical protein